MTDRQPPVEAQAPRGTTAADMLAPRRLGMPARLALVALFGIAGAVCFAFVVGFFLFARDVADMERPAIAGSADAIVALTGGAARISDAVELLNDGRADRLLITGVHPDTTTEVLAASAPGRDDLFACCVDLGYAALNTVGNAKEARDWARQHGFRRLIVVTSNYHLPRSLNEMRREMPEAVLIAYPVVASRHELTGWWRNPATARLLMSEYAKYLMSIFRLRWRPATTWDAGVAQVEARG